MKYEISERRKRMVVIKMYILIAMMIAVSLPVLSAMALTVGYDVIDRQYVDKGILTYLDPPYNGKPSRSSIPCSGKLVSWHLWARNTGEILLQVYRPIPGGYKLIGQNKVSVTKTGRNTFPISAADQISVQTGDFLGFTGPAIIPQDLSPGGHYAQYREFDANNWPSYDYIPYPIVKEIGTVVPSAIFDNNVSNNKDGEFYIVYQGEGRTYSLSADIVPE